MTRPPLPLWTERAGDAAFTAPAEIAQRADRFARLIRRRNRSEYAAGWFGIALSAALGLFFAWLGLVAQAGAVGILAIGFAVVMRNLARRAGSLAPRPEEPCLAHLKRQYRHQAAALRSVATWYVGPLLPGFAAMQAAISRDIAAARGWGAAFDAALWPVGLLTLFLLAVIALNRVAARDLERKLAALEELA